MSDLILTPLWLAALVTGVAGCVVLRAFGLASTYVRDILHIGAGVWILGWPLWTGAVAPIAIVTGVALATAMVPPLARRNRVIRSFEHSVASGDERFDGLIWYTASYAALTAAGMLGYAFPAAAALLCLSLGDGVGGMVGRRFGTFEYRIGRAKPKSVEGSLAVFGAAAVGVVVAATVLGVHVPPTTVWVIAAVAAIAEAVAPRSSDNALVPAAAFAAAYLFM